MGNYTRTRVARRGTVYVVESGGLHKIGYSRNLGRRLEEIEAGSPLPVRLVFAVSDPDASRLEGTLHGLFARSRSHSEWFWLDEDEVSDACSLLAGGEVYE